METTPTTYEFTTATPARAFLKKGKIILRQKTRYSISSIDNFYKAAVVPHDYGFVIDKDVGGLPLEIVMLEKNEINGTVFKCRHPNCAQSKCRQNN
jgi:uncharacterized protein (UPF0179 family)